MFLPHQQHGVAHDGGETDQSRDPETRRLPACHHHGTGAHCGSPGLQQRDRRGYRRHDRLPVCFLQWREFIYEIYEEICGARLTTNIGRIGGLERLFNETVWRKIKHLLKEPPAGLKEFESLVMRNPHLHGLHHRLRPDYGGEGIILQLQRPELRAAGVDYDVRVMNPYSSLSDFHPTFR